ncbi:hypothetical protein ACOSQ3_027100 [Xanthoceras sorbifolium]
MTEGIDCETEMLNIVIQNDAITCPESDQQWLQSILQRQSKQEVPKPKIQRVSPMLRRIEANKSCYDPLVVSIGPYHHGNPDLQLMEDLKFSMACQYANDEAQLLEHLYNKVMAVAEDARKCYTEGSTEIFDQNEFTRMMFLDGCFVLQFIRCFLYDRQQLKMNIFVAAFVRRDLFLIENQLPFKVLKELMSLKFNEDEWKKTFTDFVAQIGAPSSLPNKLVQFEDQPAHLLDIIHTHLIDKAALAPPPPSRQSQRDWYTYRSAKDLKEAGIYFRSSKSHRFTDVEFKSTFSVGLLKLPPIIIDDSTKSLLLNMVGYEESRDLTDDFGVSSYICFMGSLIDRAEDVKELRSKGILMNFLGTDQQVVELFTEMAENLVWNPYAYANVKEKVERHYKNKIKNWMAEWLNTNFISPWTVLALIGAIYALFVSILEAYQSIYPADQKH